MVYPKYYNQAKNYAFQKIKPTKAFSIPLLQNMFHSRQQKRQQLQLFHTITTYLLDMHCVNVSQLMKNIAAAVTTANNNKNHCKSIFVQH